VSALMSTDERWVFIDRYWWRRFLKQTDIIRVRRCDVREIARAVVKRQDVIPCVKMLMQLVSGEFHPDLALNMDESGFCQRPLRGTQKIVCLFEQRT
jgi:hypothetical protein